MTVIVTDSTCDISKERQEQLQIQVAPLLVNFEEGCYRDNVDITLDEFYNRLRKTEILPTTSQVNPGDFETIFRSIIKENDDIFATFLSSEISGTYQSAVLAREAIGSDKIFLLDSQHGSISEGLMVQIACNLRDEGFSAHQIFETLSDLIPKVRLYLIVDTLKYLHMGGRLSTASTMMGNLLGINPIISLINGKVQAVGKARGKKQAFDFVLERMQNEPADPAYPMQIGHADAPDKLASFREHMAPHLYPENTTVEEIGCVIGTHTGPGTVGIAYIAQ